MYYKICSACPSTNNTLDYTAGFFCVKRELAKKEIWFGATPV
jgi:hypothetical protein